VALTLIPNVRGAARGPFDWPGFAMTGLAGGGLYVQPGNNRARSHRRRRGAVLLAGSVTMAGCWTVRHLRRAAHPLIDLLAFRVPTSHDRGARAASPSGPPLRALPFLLPLLFQLVFRAPIRLTSGLLLLAVFAGNLAMKPATSSVLKPVRLQDHAAGERLHSGGDPIRVAACSPPETPKAIVIPLLFISGLARFRSVHDSQHPGFCRRRATPE